MLPSALSTASASQPAEFSELNLHGLLPCCVRFAPTSRPVNGNTRFRPACSALTGRGEFLDVIELREEKVPNGPGGTKRGEVVFCNLGKFSQVISDFEEIYFHSDPPEKYESFASFLQYQADGAYPEGWQEATYANPDAVRIMTIHQAKGMQWPVVFIPALLKNRFPSVIAGGKGVWHLIPADGVQGQNRFVGSIEDERRLFYVAMTRSQKFLFMTYAPVPGKNNRYAKKSEFWDDVLV